MKTTFCSINKTRVAKQKSERNLVIVVFTKFTFFHGHSSVFHGQMHTFSRHMFLQVSVMMGNVVNTDRDWHRRTCGFGTSRQFAGWDSTLRMQGQLASMSRFSCR